MPCGVRITICAGAEARSTVMASGMSRQPVEPIDEA